MNTNSNTAQVWLEKGGIEYQAQNFTEAAKYFTKAIELDPTDHFSYDHRSVCYANTKKFDEAL